MFFCWDNPGFVRVFHKIFGCEMSSQPLHQGTLSDDPPRTWYFANDQRSTCPRLFASASLVGPTIFQGGWYHQSVSSVFFLGWKNDPLFFFWVQVWAPGLLKNSKNGSFCWGVFSLRDATWFVYVFWCVLMCVLIWVVISNILYFPPYLGKIPNLTNIFQMGWNHQPVIFSWSFFSIRCG